jgi:hypothetical protein
MSPELEAYMAGLEVVLLSLLPVAFLLTLYVWSLAWRLLRTWRKSDRTEPRPLFAVAKALALTGAYVCGVILVFGLIYRYRVGPVPPWFLALQGTATVGLFLLNYFAVLYLLVVDLLDRADLLDRGKR